MPLPTVASKYPHDHVYVYLFMLQYISWPEFGLSNIHNNKNIFCTEPLYSTQLEVYNKGINSTVFILFVPEHIAIRTIG